MAIAPRSDSMADPAELRDHLDAVDAAIQELFATRSRLLDEVRDAFTGLRNSAQIFREIFYGVELPIQSVEDLIRRAGGPHRVIRISYKEFGTKVFALGDLVAAVPQLAKVFPVTSFGKLGAALEKLREELPDTGPTWFARDIGVKHLREALQAESHYISQGKPSPLTQRAAVTVTCGCCGCTYTPAALIVEAFRGLSARPSATRWIGRARKGSQPRSA